MKNYFKIFQFMAYRIQYQLVRKPLHIRFDKIDGFIMALDGVI